jgi:hypothetical protein
MPTLQLFFFSFTLWLGAYVLAQKSQKPTVHLTAWGLIAYALAFAMKIIFNQFILIVLPAPALWRIAASKETDTVL